MLLRMYSWLNRPMLGNRKQGAAFTEYAMLIALVAVVVVVALGAFGDSVSNLFDRLAGEVDSVG